MAGILYVLWDLSYTLCDIPVFSVVTTMTTNIRERNSLISYGRMFMFVGSLMAGMLIPMLYPVIGWFPAVAILAAISLLTMVPLGYAARERHAPPPEAESPSIKELLMTVVRNKYLLLLILAFIIASVSNTSLAVSGYFAIYSLGGPQIMSLTALLGIVPSIFLAALIPAMTKRMDKFYLLMGSIAGAVFFSIIMWAVGYSNLLAHLSIFTLRSICFNMLGILLPMFIVDCSEYGQFKTGENSVAVSVSLQTFASKIYTALTSAIGMYVLGLAGFVSGADAVQPPQALEAIWILNSIVPAIGPFIAFFLLMFGYRLRDKYVQLMAQANYGEITKEAAAAQLPRSL
jgi:Na+/melibiose symporter-like transporter